MIMSYLVFDIETGPAPDAARFIPEFEPPGNIRDPEKIRARALEHNAKALGRAALDPMTGQVLAIGVQSETVSGVYDCSDEALNLRQFWDLVSDTEEHYHLIGWNCREFDWPFLLKRSWILGVQPGSAAVSIYRGRVSVTQRLVDLMELWAMSRAGRASLNSVAQRLGVGSKVQENSAHYWELRQRDPEAARDHLLNDLELTQAIARKLGVIGGDVVAAPVRAQEVTV